MPTIKIEEKGCRGCTLCQEICPVDVFDIDAASRLAQAVRAEDCIGCFSCFYICPSQCIELGDVHIQRPFYRVESNVNLVERFLQEKPAAVQLSQEDWEEALYDVNSTIVALGRAAMEMLGRGMKALGRRSGNVAAHHMPEMYEAQDFDGVLAAMQQRFKNCFDFSYESSGSEQIKLLFPTCGLEKILEQTGEPKGEASLCQLFHDYLAGLLGAHTGINYTWDLSCSKGGCAVMMRAQK